MDIFLLVALPAVLLPFVAKALFPHKLCWKEFGINVFVALSVSSIVYALGVFSQIHDVEILNGEVVSKTRKHGHYERSYDCNCHQTCSGSGQSRSCSRTCSTCYEDRYTVVWTSHTTLGDYEIDSLDSGSKSVYNKPDPDFYSKINKGDPVARRHSFINYVKAAPDSLFHKTYFNKEALSLVPEYPDAVYGYYSLNRVLSIGVSIPDLTAWNLDVSNMLKTLGPVKQANVILVFVKDKDQSFVHAIEGKWIGGKKNDIIVVVGTSAFPKIDWVHVSSWTDSEIFKVKLRDDLVALQNVDRARFIDAITKNTLASFERKRMEDFEHLKYKSEPSTFILFLAVALSVITSLSLSFYFYKHKTF